MDSLTQIVLGGAVANAAIGKKAGNRAVLWGAIAGTIPDLDVFFKYTHSFVDSMAMHRGFTHSILFSVITAPILGWIIAKLYRYRRGNIHQWTRAMFLALVTHPLLDAFTTWGTSLWWPFSQQRVAISSIFVLDPLYTLPFIVCLVTSMFIKRKKKLRNYINALGLFISSAYLLLTVANQMLVTRIFSDAAELNGIEVNDLEVKPTPLNTILWTCNVESDKSFYLSYYSWLDNHQSPSFKEVVKQHELLKPYLIYPDVQQLLRITANNYVVREWENGLLMHDLRFGELAGWENVDSEFVFTYRLHIVDGKLVNIDQRPNEFEGMGKAFSSLLSRIKGNE